MAKEKVGYRRLYDAVDCGLEGAKEFRIKFDVTPRYQADTNRV